MATDTKIVQFRGAFDVQCEDGYIKPGLGKHPDDGRPALPLRLKGGTVVSLIDPNGFRNLPGGTVWLNPDATNYVELNPEGSQDNRFHVNQSAFTVGRSSLYVVTTGTNSRTGEPQIIGIEDHRGATPDEA